MKKLIAVLQGPVATRSGYGSHFRDLVRAFIKGYDDTYDIKIISTKWGACPMNVLCQGKDDDIISRLLFGNQLPEKPAIFFQCSVPSEATPIGDLNIFCTAGIETTAADPSWISGLNIMHHNIVPSKFARDVFMNTKYNKVDKNTNQPLGELKIERPIDVLFEGVDINLYKKIEEIPPTINEELKNVKEQFAFLVCGHWLKGDIGCDRKDIGMAVKIFLEVFKNKTNPPALILKTSGATFSKIDEAEILDKISMIARSVTGDLPNIYLLHGDLTDEEMNGLYNHPKVKAMVTFTKGEGFGRPLAEFCRTGKPILASNWSGHLDFLDPKFTILLPGKLTPVHKSAQWDGVINKETQWFTVDYNMAGSMMIDVFENYKTHLEKSRGSSHHIKTNFSLDAMNTKFKELVDSYIAGKPQMQKLTLPKLMKVGSNEPPKITLPKLKKITD